MLKNIEEVESLLVDWQRKLAPCEDSSFLLSGTDCAALGALLREAESCAAALRLITGGKA